MKGLDRLYSYADSNKIFVYFGHVPIAPALTIMHGDEFDIAVDLCAVTEEHSEYDYLTHELGHIATGSFYTCSTSREAKRRCETRASNWTAKFCVPLNKLKEAMQNGIVDVWDLADYFETSQVVVETAINYYTVNNGINFNEDYAD